MKPPVGEGFPKAARVRCRREYLALGKTGRRRHVPHFTLIASPAADHARLGITVSRKVGPAVVRNRLKRRLREIFRRHPTRLLPHHDVLVIAKAGAGELRYLAIARELEGALTSWPGAPTGRRP
jgi:ribonuclease P protein component